METGYPTVSGEFVARLGDGDVLTGVQILISPDWHVQGLWLQAFTGRRWSVKVKPQCPPLAQHIYDVLNPLRWPVGHTVMVLPFGVLPPLLVTLSVAWSQW